MPETGSASGGLESVFDEGTRIFGEITHLCVDQRTAIAANDTGRLGQLGERAETLAARFRLLESARIALQRELGLPDDVSVMAGPAMQPGTRLGEARRRLTEAAAGAALAASSNAELLFRTSAATAALRRLLEGAMSAGYLPNGEHRPAHRSAVLEKLA